jgi:hypothetical protein
MSKNVIAEFKRQYNLDVVNAIYLTDGDDTHGVIVENMQRIQQNVSAKIVIRSEKTNKDYVVSRGFDKEAFYAGRAPITHNLFKMVKDETGANLISFYMLHGGIERRPDLLMNKVSDDAFNKFYKTNNFYEIKNHFGYDCFYIIKSKSLSIESNSEYAEIDADIDYDDQKQMKQSIKKIIRSFDKHMTGSVKNKMFLNKLIEQIA